MVTIRGPQGGEVEPPLTPERFVSQELGHIAGTHVDAWGRPSFLHPMHAEFARAQALHYYRSGAHGITLYNWENMAGNHGYNNATVLSELGDRRTIEHRDKIYAVSRVRDSNLCIQDAADELPADLNAGVFRVTLRVAENLAANRNRIEDVTLWVNLNGRRLTPSPNPLAPGSHTPSCESIWLAFGVSAHLPHQGNSELTVELTRCNEMIDRASQPVTLTDVELDVRYDWPDGGFRPKNWYPRR